MMGSTQGPPASSRFLSILITSMLTDLTSVCLLLRELMLAFQSHRLTSAPLLSKPAIEFSAARWFLNTVDGLLDFIKPFCCHEHSQLCVSTG